MSLASTFKPRSPVAEARQPSAINAVADAACLHVAATGGIAQHAGWIGDGAHHGGAVGAQPGEPDAFTIGSADALLAQPAPACVLASQRVAVVRERWRQLAFSPAVGRA
jgi:hypothetical protein